MHIIDTDIDKEILGQYYNRISKHFHDQVKMGNPYMAFHPTRNLLLADDDPIIGMVKDILESTLRVKLTLSLAELQTWCIGSESQPHRHTYKRDELEEDYNSLLYLNNDFDGGVFFAEGMGISPEPGRLTFFDGTKVTHGLTKVSKAHRHTIIFWWKNTQFY